MSEVIGGPALLGFLHGRHGRPVGVAYDLAGILHATAQRRNAGLKALVDGGKADKLLAEGRHIAQTEQNGVVITVDLHVAGQVAAVTHDVVAIGVTGGIELTLTGDIPVGDGAGALEHHIGDYGSGEMLAGDIAIAGIVAVDKETSVGQADLVDNTA